MNNLGSHLKGIRKSKGMTLVQLSEATGLSVSYLSKAERGQTDITINNANLICNSLGVNLVNMMMADNDAHDVVRAAERKVLFESPYTIAQALCNRDMGGITFTSTTIKENAPHQHDNPSIHDFDEFGVVISGILNLYLDGIPHILYPGDTIYIRANTPRVFEKFGDEPVESYWVHLPKTE